MPVKPPQWTTRGDGFYVKFNDDEKPPLEVEDHLGDVSKGGRVDRSRCTETNQVVAVKSIITRSQNSTNTTLNNEVEILRPLRHYHSIRILGCYIHRDHFAIVMQPAAVCDLSTYLEYTDSYGAKKIEQEVGPRKQCLAKIMGCLAHGLQYIHNKQRARHKNDNDPMVRHRDIKTSNILLDGPRIVFADFGISKVFTETKTGTSGKSGSFTSAYTSPERAAGTHRNTACDIFSLACVYAEIFTVYKGRTIKDFEQYRRKVDPDDRGWYHKAQVMPAVLEWLDGLVTEGCDVKIMRLLRAMFSPKPDHRPNAEQVWKVLTTCKTSAKVPPIYFCGPCCMPFLHDDLLLTADPRSDPSRSNYVYSIQPSRPESVSRDLHFKTQYERGAQLDLRWERNSRHFSRSILDVVQSEASYLLSRKRVSSPADDEESSTLARKEAEILRAVKHRHIVGLHGTYRQGDVYALLFEPAADHDLRTYLELVSKSKDKMDLNFLTKTFGCLAKALACVHAAGYDHGDISSENILVHNRRVYLSKFSFGLKVATGRKESVRSGPLDFIGIGKLSLRQGSNQALADTERQQRQQPGPYQPPEWRPDSPGQPAADVFALGLVFIEIYTVLSSQTIRDFEDFRADDEGNTTYRERLPRTLEWLAKLCNRDHGDSDKFKHILRRMIARDASERPDAIEVARTMRACKTAAGSMFSGDCPEP